MAVAICVNQLALNLFNSWQIRDGIRTWVFDGSQRRLSEVSDPSQTTCHTSQPAGSLPGFTRLHLLFRNYQFHEVIRSIPFQDQDAGAGPWHSCQHGTACHEGLASHAMSMTHGPCRAIPCLHAATISSHPAQKVGVQLPADEHRAGGLI